MEDQQQQRIKTEKEEVLIVGGNSGVEIKLKQVRIVLSKVKLEIPKVKKENENFFLAFNTKNLKIPKPIKYVKIEKEKKKYIRRADYVKPKNFKCEKCDKAFTCRPLLASHLLQHGDFHCKICDRKFQVKAFFDKHKCRYCKICNKKFNNFSNFQTHNEIHHSTNRVKFECDFCGKLLITKTYLLPHFKAIHAVAENHDKYYCDNCGKKFGDLKLLQKHMKNHKKVECKICKRKFCKGSLKKHLDQFHLEKGSVKCEKCPKAFKSKENLQLHINFVHDKKIQCKICSKAFYYPKLLKDHLKFHKNPKTFQCKICQKNFSSSDNLKSHFKYVHDSKNHEKKFKCKNCKYSSNLFHSLKNHQKVHENYEAKLKSRSDWIKCKKCPALLATKYSYKRHLIEAHGNLKFECDLCGKICNQKGNLLRHIKISHLKKKVF